jgi:hypothetical protein
MGQDAAVSVGPMAGPAIHGQIDPPQEMRDQRRDMTARNSALCREKIPLDYIKNILCKEKLASGIYVVRSGFHVQRQ